MATEKTNNEEVAIDVATEISLDSNTKGDISMACVIAELTKRGVAVSVPMTDNKRYDLIMDYNGKLYRMQVKTIWNQPEKGILSFKTESSNTTKTKGNYSRRYKHGEIEGFLAYCVELDQVYLAWVGEVPAARFYMRTQVALNNQRKKVRMAYEYELGRKLAELEGEFNAVKVIK